MRHYLNTLVALLVLGFAWHDWGFWWGLLSALFWPVWLGYKLAEWVAR